MDEWSVRELKSPFATALPWLTMTSDDSLYKMPQLLTLDVQRKDEVTQPSL